MKTLVFAIAMLGLSIAHADNDVWDTHKVSDYGRKSGETAAQYEERICEARRTLEAARWYIDSNMLWVDNRDFQDNP